MKIGYLVPYDMICGESEARMRYTYLLEKMGHEVVPIDINGYRFDNHEYQDDYDFIISHCVNEQLNVVLPDSFLLFFFWCPTVFFPSTSMTQHLLYMNKHDAVVGGYDSKYSLLDIKNMNYFDVDKLLPAYASVPKEYAIEGREMQQRKLFYVGMGIRYKFLLEKLTKLNLVNIYGPAYAFGKKVWADYKAYRGQIKSDGKEIIKKMNDSGIVLALHGLAHNEYGYVSNRIFEAAASGSVIICDDNEFIRKYFGDSVFYVNTYKPETEYTNDIVNIVKYINNNPQKAYDMAKRSQEIFIEKLAIDNYLQNILDYVVAEKKRLASIDYGTVDVICCGDISKIKNELSRQTYKNINLVPLHCEENESIGEAFYKIYKELKGNYFMFMSDGCTMHKHHIFKLLDYINKNNTDWAYTGTYIKSESEPSAINIAPIDITSIENTLTDENADKSILRAFNKKLLLHSVIFKHDILKYTTSNVCYFNSLHLHLYYTILSALENRRGGFAYTLSAGRYDVLAENDWLYDSKNSKWEAYIVNLTKSFVKYVKPGIKYLDYQKLYREKRKKYLIYIATHCFVLYTKKVKNKVNARKREL